MISFGQMMERIRKSSTLWNKNLECKKTPNVNLHTEDFSEKLVRFSHFFFPFYFVLLFFFPQRQCRNAYQLSSFSLFVCMLPFEILSRVFVQGPKYFIFKKKKDTTTSISLVTKFACNNIIDHIPLLYIKQPKIEDESLYSRLSCHEWHSPISDWLLLLCKKWIPIEYMTINNKIKWRRKKKEEKNRRKWGEKCKDGQWAAGR